MTKARDLSNLISTGVPNSLITLDANEIPNIDASKITSGSIDTARLGNIDLTNLSATNLTSGTIPDARVSASAVSQHATSFDDNKIVNDISTLAIRQASNENKGAYNTNSMYVDVFQDDTGIGTETNTDRDSNEFVSAVIQGTQTATADSGGTLTSLTSSNTAFFSNQDRKTYGTGDDLGYTGTSYNYNHQSSSALLTGNFVVGFTGVSHDFGSTSASSVQMYEWGVADNSATIVGNDGSIFNASKASGNVYFMGQGGNNATTAPVRKNNTSLTSNISGGSAGSSVQTRFARMNGRLYIQYDGVNKYTFSQSDFNDTSALWFICAFGQTSGVRAFNNCFYRSGMTAIKGLDETVNVVNATGNFISNVITAPSSTNKMGAIITYQDQAGTNALNTDIVLQLSADNGSNFTTATMTAMPDFASGIKMAKVNDLSVTAGTQLKYKISFANQASGSKEARIRGVSLQY